MRRAPHFRRLLTGFGLALALALTSTALATAAWSGSGSGTADAMASTMPTGSQPTATVSGTSVSLSWSAALFADTSSVAGYVINRFNAVSGAEVPVGAGCDGIVATTTCTELNVSAGTWIYTDSPVQDDWSGGQSPASFAVTVP